MFIFTAKLFKLPSRSLILSRLSSVLATSFDACSESCPLVESETVVPPLAPRDAAGPAELPAPCVTRHVGRTNSIYRNICIEISLCVYPIHGNLCAAGVTLWAWLPTTCARRMDASSCRPRAHAHAPRCSTEAQPGSSGTNPGRQCWRMGCAHACCGRAGSERGVTVDTVAPAPAPLAAAAAGGATSVLGSAARQSGGCRNGATEGM